MKYKIADSHNDFFTEIEEEKIIKTLKKYYAENVKILNSIVWTTELKEPLTQIKKLKEIIINQKQIKCILSIEDMGFVDESNIDQILALHPTFCGIVWNNDNKFAGGAFGNNDLSLLGKNLIQILEKNNILIDTAHMNKKTFDTFCKITTKPIFNSHSNIYAKKKHKRNLTDNQIKQIVNSNGFLGITFVSDFIKANSTAKDVAFQIDYLINNFGYKNFGIGTDFNGTKHLPKNLNNYKDFKNLYHQLKKMGYNQKIIDHIFYKNFKDFLTKNNLIP